MYEFRIACTDFKICIIITPISPNTYCPTVQRCSARNNSNFGEEIIAVAWNEEEKKILNVKSYLILLCAMLYDSRHDNVGVFHSNH